MKKYVWGSYNGAIYSVLEVSESENQVVIRPVGTKTHLTLHKLDILEEKPEHWIVSYQKSPLILHKNLYAPISYNWNSPIIRGAWSDAKVTVAKSLKFRNPDKHAESSQGLLVKFDNFNGYDIGSSRIEINDSMSKQKYLKKNERIGKTIPISSVKFMVRIILSMHDSKYKGQYDFSHTTGLGELFLLIEDALTIRLKGS